MTLTPEEQATAAAAAAAQDPSGAGAAPAAEPVPTPAAPSTAPATPVAKTPWDADLAEIFPDEAQRAIASQYLQTKVQPYVTQLEQSNVQAKELLDDFRTAPKDTFLEIANELVEEGAITAADLTEYVGTLTPAEQAQVAEAAAATPPTEQAPVRDPEVQALIDRDREAQDKAAFDTEYARIKQVEAAKAVAEGRTPLVFKDELYIPLVAQLGSFEKAVDLYQEQYGDYLAWQAANPPAPAAPAPTPPEALGSGEATGGSEQPTEKQYETLEEAVDDFFAERRAVGDTVGIARPAPPVATG